MSRSKLLVKWALPLFILIVCRLSAAKDSKHMPQLRPLDTFLDHLANWRWHYKEASLMELSHGYRTMAAMALSFVAATISSAGGVGGGPLFLPILNIVAGLDLKTAASYSSFMVTGVLLSGVLCNLFFASLSDTGEPFVNYEITVLTEPCMLLGVSLGVICNVMFPEWLITVLFTVFLAYSTYKTCNAGIKCWKAETGSGNRGSSCRLNKDKNVEGKEHGMEEPLLSHAPRTGLRRKVPWKDVVFLVMVWVCFFLFHVLLGNSKGKGVIHTEPCGVAFWLMKFAEVPFAIAFTVYVIYQKSNSPARHIQQLDGKMIGEEETLEVLPRMFFPLAALLTGFLSGLFGVGGGLLVNPLLLQIGLPPQTASATSTFMLLFSSSMTMVQYVILGMSAIGRASAYALLCFVASACGSAVIQRVVEKSGRVSLTIFAVTVVMALSTVIVTGVGAIDIWAEYAGGHYMGFRPPC